MIWDDLGVPPFQETSITCKTNKFFSVLWKLCNRNHHWKLPPAFDPSHHDTGLHWTGRTASDLPGTLWTEPRRSTLNFPEVKTLSPWKYQADPSSYLSSCVHKMFDFRAKCNGRRETRKYCLYIELGTTMIFNNCFPKSSWCRTTSAWSCQHKPLRLSWWRVKSDTSAPPFSFLQVPICYIMINSSLNVYDSFIPGYLYSYESHFETQNTNFQIGWARYQFTNHQPTINLGKWLQFSNQYSNPFLGWLPAVMYAVPGKGRPWIGRILWNSHHVQIDLVFFLK